MSKKERFEDDGRTIADMSGVERPPLILPNIKRFKELRAERKAAQDDSPEVFSSEEGQYRKHYESSEDKETRKAYLGGAISATLVIALIYLGAFALLVVILLLIWGVL